jgi:hypothetical protein
MSSQLRNIKYQVSNIKSTMSNGSFLPVLILCLAVFGLFYRIFLGEVIFWGTPALQFYPWRKMAFDMLKGGQLPLWNPLVGNGAPLLANYQTAVFYPPNWLYLIIPTEYAMGLVGVIHIIWAGLGMMVYLRRLGIQRLGQGVGALAFSLGGYLVSRFGFLSITSAVPWLPWLMWAIDGVVLCDRDQMPRGRNVVLLGLIAAMQLLAGHAQTTFYSMVLAGTYTLWRVLASPRNENGSWATRGKSLGLVLGGLLLGAAVAAIQLIPTFELLQSSQRAGGVEESFALNFSFWPPRFLTLIAPNLFGSPALGNYWGLGAYWEDAIYVGLLTLLMAGYAGVRWRRERRNGLSPAARVVPFYVLLLPPVFVLALGGNTPVFPWLYRHVPTFSMFQAPTRWTLLAVFALSVLGAVGIDGWRAARRETAWMGLMTAGGVSVVMGAVVSSYIAPGVVEPTYLAATIRLGVTLVVLGAVFLLLPRYERHPARRFGWEAGVLALLAADLVTAHWGLTPTLPADYYHQASEFAQSLAPYLDGYRTFYMPDEEEAAKIDTFLDFKDLEAGDRPHWDMMREVLVPDAGMDADVASANNFDPLQVGYYARLLRSLDGKAPVDELSVLQQMNVGVLLTARPYADFALVGQVGPVLAYRVPNPWPRAALAHCDEVNDTLSCQRIAEGQAAIFQDEPMRVGVTVQTGSAATLVLADTFYPGWLATVDGVPVPIRRANTAFRAVDVPAGEHEVVFEYRPVSVWIGMMVSCIGIDGIASVGYRKKQH